MSKVKGAGPKTTLEWVRKNYGEEGFKKVLDGCTPSTRSTLEAIIISAWYPTAVADDVCVSFANSGLVGKGPNLDRAFRLLGVFIAENNLSTLYKVVFKFVTPDTMLGLLPRMWKTYFDGIETDVQHETEGPNTGTCRVKGLGDFRYISPLAAGWVEFAYKKVGAAYISAQELNYRQDFPNPDELIYKLRWKKNK